MRDFRIKVLWTCAAVEIFRLFDVQAESVSDALKAAASFIFGEPFNKDDFEITPLNNRFYRRATKYKVGHKRIELLYCELEIKKL